ncbi:hypothetical protein F5884DRAFT_776002 [Xylogone sp. PMI_703]|nr:hypothetical protein F5884DRAFT_776002 [Xylogone sp. PMI_703]
MSASSSAASSTLSRYRPALILLTTVAAAYGIYYIHSTRNEASTGPPSGGGLHRSNAVYRRRRREPSASHQEGAVISDESGDNEDEDGILRVPPLNDGDTVVDEQVFQEDFTWSDVPPPEQRTGQNIVQLLFRVSEDATRRNAYVHRGCACNSCGALPIRGIRYRCANCADFDLCEGCEAQGLHTKTHIFYKVRVPAPSFGPRQIQPVWYTGDPDSCMRSLHKELITKLSRETGFERPELDAYWEQWTFMANTEWREDPDDIGLAMDRQTFERCLVPSSGYRHPSPSLIFDRMFSFYDTNKDNLISFSEFLHGLAWRKKKEKWPKIFEGYDMDGDGYVDRKDFLRMFRSYYVLYRQMHRDMLEGLDEQTMSTSEAQQLVTSRQPLSSYFGRDGRFPRALEPRTGEGKTPLINGDLEIIDGNGVITESNNDTGNREDVFRDHVSTRSAIREPWHTVWRSREGRGSGYWDTLLNPPESGDQIPDLLSDLTSFRQQLEGVLEGRRYGTSYDSLSLETDGGHDAPNSYDKKWPPDFVGVTDEDAEAIVGPGTKVADVPKASRRAVVQHAVERQRARRLIHERWQRRQFYTDEEEGATPPLDWNEEEDVLALNNKFGGESSKAPSQRRASRHSRSSSKVRFAEDTDDFETRSNASTTSRSVPERWGGMEIPDAERDVGKEILYQVTQQAFNELLDPLFKEHEDLALKAVCTKASRDKYRHLFTPEFVEWANNRLEVETTTEDTEEDTRKRSTTVQEGLFPGLTVVELPELRAHSLEDLLAATGYQVLSEQEEEEEEEEDDEEADMDSERMLDHEPPTTSEVSFMPQQDEAYPNIIAVYDDETRADPTLPQFRPNSLSSHPVIENTASTPAPASSDASTFLEQENHAVPSSGEGSDPYLTPEMASALTANGGQNDDLYNLWLIERAAKNAETAGGWGRLDYEDFLRRIQKCALEGKGNSMDYLGSWIEFCIP